MTTDNREHEIPRGNAAGFVKYFKSDIVSGFLVFLIALPLCLGISLACGYPPIAGIFTAIIGAILSTFISNSELTIKGPAAGLIVIAIGCIEDFGGAGDVTAYKAALAVGVAAAVMQIIFGLFRAGILGEFFPISAVHGMLAAIGVIIILKQFPVALGVKAGGEPLEMLKEIPHYIAEANPAIAAIGIVSILIMFFWPLAGKKMALLKKLPSPLVVLLVSVPMGMGFDLLHQHSYTLQGHEYQLSDQYLVAMPDRMFGMFDYITTPDFTALGQPRAWKWITMFFIIGSLESLLSAKAVDLLDPWKRKTNMNRDIVAVGVGNLAAAFVGGLPMISEIVRSESKHRQRSTDPVRRHVARRLPAGLRCSDSHNPAPDSAGSARCDAGLHRLSPGASDRVRACLPNRQRATRDLRDNAVHGFGDRPADWRGRRHSSEDRLPCGQRRPNPVSLQTLHRS